MAKAASSFHETRCWLVNDPYRGLKTSLRSEIDRDAWETLHGDTSRPFENCEGGRIPVKVINHLGDEVMKVFEVE